MAQGQKKGVDPHGLPAATMKHLRCIAESIPRRTGLRPEDGEDIMQEAALRIIQARGGYDVERGASEATYLNHVANNAVKMSLRARRAMKVANLELTLDVPLDGEKIDEDQEGDRVIDTVKDERWRESQRASDLKMDVETVLAYLTPLERKACLALKAGVPKVELPRLLGIRPSRFKHQFMPELMRKFKRIWNS